MAHAAVQRVADLADIDVLHIKGFALDPSLIWDGRVGSDVDVLVRPSQVDRLLRALRTAGWVWVTGFAAGSPFGHAATLFHELWGYVDVHRMFPGVELAPAAAFEILWRDRGTRTIAGTDCAVPALDGQVVVLLLHAAREAGATKARRDVETVWVGASPERQNAVRALAERLQAQMALAAAVGELAMFRGQRGYELWRVVSTGGTRAEEWWARFLAAGSLAERMAVLWRAIIVNSEHLAVVLGHPPTKPQIIREFFARPMRAALEEYRTILLRVRKHQG
ncbi:nucleotidyltransferase family protein [Raineyella antarctica]|uniref:nucleotidyltransferase family protein n=1 Tax=Raineyella antarctica TaxID=1577474 RepID=UPI003CCB8B67